MTDTAKELLALADEMVALARAVNHGDDLDRGVVPFTLSHAADALRLSARQQASARNLANAILDAPAGSATAMARALLAKYDIFEKMEG